MNGTASTETGSISLSPHQSTPLSSLQRTPLCEVDASHPRVSLTDIPSQWTCPIHLDPSNHHAIVWNGLEKGVLRPSTWSVRQGCGGDGMSGFGESFPPLPTVDLSECPAWLWWMRCGWWMMGRRHGEMRREFERRWESWLMAIGEGVGWCWVMVDRVVDGWSVDWCEWARSRSLQESSEEGRGC